jgi:hypothetical protein
MLVHMAPEEVSGLQALARAGGGTLTLNPDTGLPEANFLKRMLPMLIGAGITAATGGAAAPWMVGLGLGGLETARTGSLEKGLMAGLGAYGGAGLAGGLAGLGSTAVTPQAMTAANAAADPIASLAAAKDAATAAGAVAPTGFGAISAGAQQAMTNPSALINQMGGGMDAAKYGLAALGPMMQPETAKPYDGGGPNPYEYDFDPTSQTYTRVAPGSRQRDMLRPTTPMMAAGGSIEEMSDRNQMQTMMANGGQMFAAGGVSNLGDYSDGGRLLKGPGDGVSDSIPATIANKRPARLADGEFVVPARIVSELGNGSTEAGARKLYAMMDRVQKARGKTTGKDRVAVNSRAEKLLPA